MDSANQAALVRIPVAVNYTGPAGSASENVVTQGNNVAVALGPRTSPSADYGRR
jgi:hypothetical protein